MRLAAFLILAITLGVAILASPVSIKPKERTNLDRVCVLFINALCFASAIYLYFH